MRIKNRYEIIRDLAEGGFGKTFLAKDTDWRDRLCVVKQLRIAQDHPDFAYIQDKFRQEAKVLDDLGEAIDHIPALRNQIPKLYAYFTEANLFYLVQQWIPGKTLAEQVKSGVLNEQQVRQFLVDILPVLQMIHHRGIIHRDIKPSNIILRETDGKPVLIDFGAVKELAEIAANPDTYFHPASQNSIAGFNEPTTGIGTPGFMAPEQETCEPLYSLGITAIYALSGQVFRGSHTGKAKWRFFSANLSSGFSAILDKAIQSDPFERYSSAQDMRLALQGLSPLPDSSDPTPEPLKTTRIDPVPRRTSPRPWLRPLAFSVTGLLLAIAAGYFYSNYQMAQGELSYQKAQAELKKIEDLKKQGNHQDCVIEAKRFAQSHTLSYLNPAAEAEQLESECVIAIVNSIEAAKTAGDYATCIAKAQKLIQSSTSYPDSITKAEDLQKECQIAADLQNYLRIDVPELLQKLNQSEIAKVIAKIQPAVRIENTEVIITYDSTAHPEFATNSGLQNLTAFFISALGGQSKEFPDTKYADFSRLTVSPKGKSITATVTKEKWDIYLKAFNQASLTTEQERLKKQFIEQIQVSTS
jgi:tRNA A-37 threonylcarbamoyl transferase component Bud32